MPSYYYRARDQRGDAHEGIEVAASEDEVLRILETSKLLPVLIEPRRWAMSSRSKASTTCSAR